MHVDLVVRRPESEDSQPAITAVGLVLVILQDDMYRLSSLGFFRDVCLAMVVATKNEEDLGRRLDQLLQIFEGDCRPEPPAARVLPILPSGSSI